METFHTRLVPIGNSQGVRIPKAIVERLNLHGEITMRIQKDGLLLRQATLPRADWAERICAINRKTGCAPVLDLPDSMWDEGCWEW